MVTTNGDLLTSLFTNSDQAPKPQARQTARPVLLPAPTLAPGSQLQAPPPAPHAHPLLPLCGPLRGSIHIQGGVGISLPKNSLIIVK